MRFLCWTDEPNERAKNHDLLVWERVMGLLGGEGIRSMGADCGLGAWELELDPPNMTFGTGAAAAAATDRVMGRFAGGGGGLTTGPCKTGAGGGC